MVERLIGLLEVLGRQGVPCSLSRIFLQSRRHLNLVPPQQLFAFSWGAEWRRPSFRSCRQPHVRFPLRHRDSPRPLQILNLFGKHPRVSEVLETFVPFSEVFCASGTWPLPWSSVFQHLKLRHDMTTSMHAYF